MHNCWSMEWLLSHAMTILEKKHSNHTMTIHDKVLLWTKSFPYMAKKHNVVIYHSSWWICCLLFSQCTNFYLRISSKSPIFGIFCAFIHDWSRLNHITSRKRNIAETRVNADIESIKIFFIILIVRIFFIQKFSLYLFSIVARDGWNLFISFNLSSPCLHFTRYYLATVLLLI